MAAGFYTSRYVVVNRYVELGGARDEPIRVARRILFETCVLNGSDETASNAVWERWWYCSFVCKFVFKFMPLSAARKSDQVGLGFAGKVGEGTDPSRKV